MTFKKKKTDILYKTTIWWRCLSCKDVFEYNKLPQAKNPFYKKLKITGCPKCFSVDSFCRTCDAEPCDRDAIHGYTANDGVHKSVCTEHYQVFHRFFAGKK